MSGRRRYVHEELTGEIPMQYGTDLVSLPVNTKMSNWVMGQFERGYRGWAVDVGAADGKLVSSTWVMEKQSNWTVLCVEANPFLAQLLKAERTFVEVCAVGAEPADRVDFHINMDNLEAGSALKPERRHPKVKAEDGGRWTTTKVPVRTLEQILDKWQFPRLDALLIDVEGGEIDVLKGIDLAKWRPRVVVVESWDEGTLDEELPGYDRICRDIENDCYVRRD